MTTFLASDVEIFRFSNIPDSVGCVVPLDAKASWSKVTKILYGSGAEETQIGTAVIRRHKNSLLADMVLKSTMKDSVKALGLMRKLYPAIAFNATSFDEDRVYELVITELILTPYKNDDKNIKMLGNNVIIKPNKGDLH